MSPIVQRILYHCPPLAVIWLYLSGALVVIAYLTPVFEKKRLVKSEHLGYCNVGYI